MLQFTYLKGPTPQVMASSLLDNTLIATYFFLNNNIHLYTIQINFQKQLVLTHIIKHIAQKPFTRQVDMVNPIFQDIIEL